MVRAMAAEQDIHRALRSYCRGVDRIEPAAVLAAFHPDAELRDYQPEPMSVQTFVDEVLASLEQRFSATQHRISNTTIELEGDEAAVVETYVLAFHVSPGRHGDPDRLHTFNGRYIDRFETRGGPWLIARRSLRVDWSRVETLDETMGGSWVTSGRAGNPDPLYDPPA